MKSEGKYIFLCVDDEESVLESLKEQLRNSFGNSFVYETAESASEALEIIAETPDPNKSIVILL
ncbi:MAG: hypothetical protein K8R21_00565 [Leptospira sp.]|nr:hypothetical protein [Leptospira sp.]